MRAETLDNAPAPTVLQLVPALDEGGVERGAIEIAAAIAGAGGRALVASRGGRLEAALQRAGGELIRMDIGSKSLLRLPGNVARLRRLIGAEQVDIVHARSRAPGWAGYLAARRQRAAFVTTFHGSYSEGLPGKRLYNSVMARGQRVIAISEHIATLIRQRYPDAADRIVTIPRGADLAVFDPDAVNENRMIELARSWRADTDPRPILLLPGRLTRWKGQMLLLEAAARLRERADAPEFRVILAGGDAEGRFAREIESRAARLGLADRVRLVGPVSYMPAAYKLASVVVCPSLEPEAFGRTAVEAQAMGRLVIAADHGGARETIAPGETGWLTEPGDATELAGALREALTLNEDRRQRMAVAARIRVAARFSVATMQRATLGLYARLLAGSG